MVILTWCRGDGEEFFFGAGYYRGSGPCNGHGVGYVTGCGRSNGFRDGRGVGYYPQYAIIGVSA